MDNELLLSPHWWSALRLDERRGRPAPVTEEQRRYGLARRRLWRGGTVFPDRDVDLQRWYAAGVTENHLESLLGEPAAALAARVTDAPAYLRVIEDAWGRYGTTAVETRHTERPNFLELVRPLVMWARDEVRAAGARLSAEHGCPCEIGADHPLLGIDPSRMGTMISRALVLELNVARLEGRLAGDTAEARFAAFVDQLAAPEGALTILAEYPVLARELVEHMQAWIAVRTEFADRLLTDLPRLRDTFGGTWRGLDDLLRVEFGAGDTHRGGRTVATVTFTDETKIVYKPRPVTVEQHFADLVGFLNERGLKHQLRTLTVVTGDGHGWVEYAATTPCASEAEAARFFWRQGAHLALFNALCGDDLHLENVIAAGEHPVFVDLETIFQGRRAELHDPMIALYGAAPRTLAESVLGMGLLPQRVVEVDDVGFRDAEVSGLAGGREQLTPGLVPRFEGDGTDEMRLIRERIMMPAGDNLATLDGVQLDVTDHQIDLVEGFEACYSLISANCEELLAPDGPIAAFANDEIRHVVRNTALYGRFQGESGHPDVLRDALDREYLFESALAEGLTGMPRREGLVASEHRQLMAGDIPHFHTTPTSIDLHDDQGVVVAGFLIVSGMDLVTAKIRGMSDHDLRLQRWCIDAAFATVAPAEKAAEQLVTPQPLPPRPADAALAVQAATAVGDHLLDNVLTGSNVAPHWLSLNLVADRLWTVGPAGIGQYEGVSGIALFLAQLAEAAGQHRYREPAERIAAQLADFLRNMEKQPALADGLSLGGFGDLGGAVYLLTCLGSLWGEPTLFDAAHRAAPVIATRFATDSSLDVIYGTAGAALSLLALQEVAPDERLLDALATAGTVLLERAVPVGDGLAWHSGIDPDVLLAGLSHGASGFALALARIAALRDDGELYAACSAALRFEEALFSTDLDNWVDRRSIAPDGAYLNAWCHGAAGIGTVRAELAGHSALADYRAEIDRDLWRASAIIARDLVVNGELLGTGNDSLCHGDLGLVAAAQAVAPLTGAPELSDVAGRVCASVAASVLDGHFRPGVPSAVPTPGLLTGVAGIGYGLLRSALPGTVPDVLTLSAPRAR